MPSDSGAIVFPWFTFENHESSRPWLGLKEMRDALERGGFRIRQIFDIEGQLLNPEISQTPINHIRFEVSLPAGWKLVEGFDGYGLPDRTLLHLLDTEGHLRGQANVDCNNGLRLDRAEFFCRYVLNPFGGFYNRSIAEVDKDDVIDVVVDRASVKRERPHNFPVVAYHHTRSVAKGPFVLPSSDELERWFVEDAERVRAGRPQLDPPIYKWLHEKHPEWRDPFAYW